MVLKIKKYNLKRDKKTDNLDNSRNSTINNKPNNISYKKEEINNQYNVLKGDVSEVVKKEELDDILDLDNLDIDKNIQKKEIAKTMPISSKTVKKSNNSQLPPQQAPVKQISRDKSLKSKKDNVSFFKKISNIFTKKKEDTDEQNSNVNLLPKDLKIVSSESILNIAIYTLLISIVILFVVYFGIVIYKINIEKQLIALNSKTQEALKDVEHYDKVIDDAEDSKSRINKIIGLFNKHIYWTQFFSKIEKSTLPEVKFNAFAGNITGNIVLSASAPDYYTVARQWLYLKNKSPELVKDIIIEGASASGSASAGADTRINFSITLDLNDDVFIKQI